MGQACKTLNEAVCRREGDLELEHCQHLELHLDDLGVVDGMVDNPDESLQVWRIDFLILTRDVESSNA